MLKNIYPFYLGNKPVMSDNYLEVKDKYTKKLATKVSLANPKHIDEAINKALKAESIMKNMPAYKLQDILNHCVKRFTEKYEELAMSLCIEAGKPIKDSRGEVSRLIDTFRIASEESVRMTGEVIPMDITPRACNYSGMWKRTAIGICSFITPFNFPLNLVAHKVAPCIAVGNPFILKPASNTPIGALIIGEILAETDLPDGAFSILPCSRDGAELFTTDNRLKLLSFTGSPDVGWNLKAKAGMKKVVLELGGNAGCIVDEDSDIDDAINRIVIGAFYQSGQSCISVQRIIIHENIYSEFVDKLVSASKKLKIGDPKDESTFIGPIISESEAKRIESWINSAVNKGAKVLCGGKRHESMIEPTILENVPKTEKICSLEVFGPVVVLSKFSDFDEALNAINDSIYGLQAGIFTKNIYKAHKAWDKLDVGGVVIGDSPSWRVDHMPYGGVKNSGIGREGVRFAMEDMTEIKLLVLRTP